MRKKKAKHHRKMCARNLRLKVSKAFLEARQGSFAKNDANIIHE